MQFSGDLTYQLTNDVSRGNKTDSVSFSPRFLGNANVSGSLKHFQFGLQLNYVGAMKPFIILGESANDLPTYIGEETDSYFRLGLNFRVNDIRFSNIQKEALYFNLRGSNLLGKTYKYPTYTLNKWADLGMLGRGRQILATLGYRF